MCPLHSVPPDTIVAPLTAPGSAAVAILRVSGPIASRVLAMVFSPRRVSIPAALRDRRMHLGSMLDHEGAPVDIGLGVFHGGPKSYTGEDLFELHVHGNDLVVEALVGACLSCGCRLARPGEFSRRAFENGKMDLTQAEAVMGIVSAGSTAALKLLHGNLSGAFGNKLERVKELTVECLKWLEMAIDFPEEVDGYDVLGKVGAGFESLQAYCQELLRGGHVGELIGRGPIVAFAGRPNVGKSSLFNRLLGVERAIVTRIPGTTRDVLEGSIRLGGIRVRLHDTAGIRESTDEVEQVGIRRALDAALAATVVVHLVDATDPDLEVLNHLRLMSQNATHLLAVNKVDMVDESKMCHNVAGLGLETIYTSALDGTGTDELLAAVERILMEGSQASPEAAIVSRRQLDLLDRVCKSVNLGIGSIEHGLSEEAAATHLYEVLDLIDEMVGSDSSDHTVDAIFQDFCIGK